MGNEPVKYHDEQIYLEDKNCNHWMEQLFVNIML